MREAIHLRLPLTTQFDVLADGTLEECFGLTLFFKTHGRTWKDEFSSDKPVGSALRTLEGLGLADDRWRLLEGASRALRMPVSCEDGGMRLMGVTCLPSCCKLKWVGGHLLPARWYQSIRVFDLEDGRLAHDNPHQSTSPTQSEGVV